MIIQYPVPLDNDLNNESTGPLFRFLCLCTAMKTDDVIISYSRDSSPVYVRPAVLPLSRTLPCTLIEILHDMFGC